MKRIYKTEFHAAHYIKDHPRCGVMHGHSYQLKVSLDFEEDIWVDFADLKKLVDEILKPYDHTSLGNMTCERLAREIREVIAHRVNELFDVPEYRTTIDCTVTVELWETSDFGVIAE